MKKTIRVLSVALLVMVGYSLIPTAALYLGPSPKPYTNEEAAAKLARNEGEDFKFVILSDNHSGLVFNDSATLKIIRSINREGRFNKIPIDFVAICGDITFRGSAWDYAIFNKIRGLINRPVISAFGNHDNDGNGAALVKNYIGPKEISFTDRNSYFIVLDNGTDSLNEEQFIKFEAELKKSSTYKHRFVIIHKAPLSPYQQSWYRPELSPWSNKFMQLCEKYKVDMVFSGHEHMFKDSVHGGVRYINTGGGGMLTTVPASDGGYLNYVVVRVYGGYVDYEVRKVFPPFWEYISYYLWKDILYAVKSVLI